MTAEAFHPAPLGDGVATALTSGTVLSILMPVAAAGALTLPALSVQVPGGEDWLAPSALSVAMELQLAMPDVASLPPKATDTLLLFQPLLLGSGDGVAVATGAVASRLTVTDLLAVPPVLVAEQLNVTPVVSTVTKEAEQPVWVVIAESGSLTLQATLTSLVYQPLAPSVPVMVGAMTQTNQQVSK